MKPISTNNTKAEVYFRVLDYWLVVPVICIAIIGLFVLSNVLATGYGGEGPAMLTKQAGAVFFGIMIAFLLGSIEPPTVRLLSYAVYALSVILLLAVLLDNFTMEHLWGADRWLKLPVIGTFQPSELAKVGIITVMAYILADIKEKRISAFKGILILFAVFILPVILIMRQPDLGTVLVICFIVFCMLFVYGVKYRYIFLFSSLAVAFMPLAWSFFLAPHQKNRILTFLYPGFNPEQSYNIEQARLAISSGGLTGNPGGQGVYVPVKESDFIYTAVAEQLGLIGTTAVIALLFFFVLRSLYVASNLDNFSHNLIVTGIAAMFGIHAVENLGMCVGIMPITGIPLPFVSLGGSSMVVNFFALGIILSISMEHNIIKKIQSYELKG